MQVVSEHFRGGGFGIFAKLWSRRGPRCGRIPAPKGGSRKFADRMNAWAQKEGLPGMGYIFWREAEDGSGTEAAGPIAKALGPERTGGDPDAARAWGSAMRRSSWGASPTASRRSRAARAP
jgi:aspartyl-tRNA synthetase